MASRASFLLMSARRCLPISASAARGNISRVVLQQKPAPQQFQSLLIQKAFATEARRWDELNLDELKALQQSGDLVLIDVREPEEVAQYGKIPGALNIPLGRVTNVLRMSDEKFYDKYACSKPQHHDNNIVFYGYASAGTSVKSEAATKMAAKLGYLRARNYVGGYQEWLVAEGKKE